MEFFVCDTNEVPNTVLNSKGMHLLQRLQIIVLLVLILHGSVMSLLKEIHNNGLDISV